MKLAVSQIAWDASEDAAAAAVLAEYGVSGIEVVPARVTPDPAQAGASAETCRQWWEQRGMRCGAMQALLFGRPDLTLFSDRQSRDRTREYLVHVIRLGARLGAGALVFGAPQNRRVGGTDRSEARRIATAFFRDLAQVAHECGTALCLEPNPIAYGCDFITSTAEAAELVDRVGSPGLRINLDTGALALNGESVEEVIERYRSFIGHVHISEPYLAPIDPRSEVHRRVAQSLRKVSYTGLVSVEMRSAGNGQNLTALRTALVFVRSTYGMER